MSGEHEALRDLYAAFNSRDIEAVLAGLHVDVAWPNGWEGGVLHGREAVRDYWRRQWAAINPTVSPTAYDVESDGRIAVTVHQRVLDLAGAVQFDGTVIHVYRLDGALVRAMEIRDGHG
jgi:ketosteroid isomerase-like protein